MAEKMTEKQVMERIKEINSILDAKEAQIPNGTRYHTITRYKSGARIIQTADGKKYLFEAITLYQVKNKEEARDILMMSDERAHYQRQLEIGSWAGGDLTKSLPALEVIELGANMER